MWRPPSANDPRSVTILGATGSVGRQTLALIDEKRDCYKLEALTAFDSVDALASLALEFRPKLAVIVDDNQFGPLRERLAGSGIDVASGRVGLIEAAQRPADWVMAGIVGAAGLEPTVAAVRRGAMVAFANKECLVCAGDLFIAEATQSGAVLLPVDSEHNAIFQSIQGSEISDIEAVILTASGGPFRLFDVKAMANVTPQQATAHPVWSMGPKISVDSATMMNKGLEIIEAHYLFDIAEKAIEIVVHPQSIIHSMVRFRDGSMLAQLGEPDMRIPIAYALGWPGRLHTAAPRLDLEAATKLIFEPPDPERFPALSIARDALRVKNGAPTVLNAANEMAVDAFLKGRIGFLDICKAVETTLERSRPNKPQSLEDVFQLDQTSRLLAESAIGELERQAQ